MSNEVEQGSKDEQRPAAGGGGAKSVRPAVFFGWAAGALVSIFVLTALALYRPSASVTAAGPAASVTLPYFLAVFATATVLLLALIRLMKRVNMAAALLRLSCVTGLAILAWRLGGEVVLVLALPVGVWLTRRAGRVWQVNLAVVLAGAGVAAQIGGAMAPVTAAIVLSVLAIYDLVAVFGTGHMVYLARKLAASGAVFAFTVPARGPLWNARFADVKPGGEYGLLGMGDLVLPTLLFAATAGSWPLMIGTAVGTLVGLAALIFWLLPKSEGFMPALPPLVLGATAGFGLASVFTLSASLF